MTKNLKPLEFVLALIGIGLISYSAVRIVSTEIAYFAQLRWNTAPEQVSTINEAVDVITILSANTIAAAQTALARVQSSVDVIVWLVGFATVALSYISWTIRAAENAAIEAASKASETAKLVDPLTVKMLTVDRLTMLHGAVLTVMTATDEISININMTKIMELISSRDEQVRVSALGTLQSLLQKTNAPMRKLMSDKLKQLLSDQNTSEHTKQKIAETLKLLDDQD